MRMMTSGGIKVLDGIAYERDGVGFAGTKGFVAGFGRDVLTAFGEPEIKTFVRASIDEALSSSEACRNCDRASGSLCCTILRWR
jgi:hypothetical protein